ncbi:MAG: hypothetical protein JWL85_290 [Candidatus Saccharibacteria bacterium]|nr:hypothetical protein [Candidatus Saccharibacteria bacterium]
MPTFAGIALRSYYPEKYLIDRRDTKALMLKYSTQLEKGTFRVHSLLNFMQYQDQPDLDTSVYKNSKILGSIVIANEKMRASGEDSNNIGVRVQRGHEVVGLHLNSLGGHNELMSQLSTAAAYVNAHEELYAKPFITGVTYSKLANLALRVGFREMAMTEIEEGLYCDIWAAHMVYCALNSRIQQPYEPKMVYLPTPEFVEKFSQPALAMAEK